MAESTVQIRVELDQEQIEALEGLAKAAARITRAMNPPAETATLENPRSPAMSRIPELQARRAAFDAINGERDYQDERWGRPRHAVRDHSPAEWILYMEEYLSQARSIAASEPDGPRLIMHAIRKVAALAVAAMEVNGSPKR